MMGLARDGFSYEPIGDNTQPLPLHQRAWTRRASRKNIGTLIMWGASLGALAAFWGSTRTSFGTKKPPSSPAPATSAPATSAAADASFVVLPIVSDGGDAAVSASSEARLMRQVRVFTESYRGTTNTTRYGALVAEPHRENTLEVDVTSNNLDDVELRWEVDGQAVGSGAAITTTFGAPGEYKCSVVAYRAAAEKSPDKLQSEGAGQTSSTPQHGGLVDALLTSSLAPPTGGAGAEIEIERLEFVVAAKYVRREIRKLTDRDREAFFNAVAVMQRVPSAVGQVVYGNKYYSKDFFNRIHLYYGGRRDCDHWHGGAGFVTSHIGITLMFEQSLQAINPSIALPYWDVTIEGTFYDWTNFRTSSVFSDDWFGSAAPQNTVRTPGKGRFAFVPTMMNATEYSGVVSPYGMLRSPWNADRNPFLTRSDMMFGFKNNKKPSGCKRYRDAKIAANWMQQTESFNGGAHGNIHGLLGGTWSAEADEYAAKTPDIVLPFVHHVYISQKIMWRTGHIECPDSCAVETPWEDCQCTCSEAAMAGKTSAQFLEEAHALSGTMYDKDWNKVGKIADSEGNAYDIIPGYTKEETDDIYDTLLSVLCIPTKVGSHFEATSTNDITFHVLHPTFDRLWHLTRLDRAAGFDETWINDSECYGHNSGDVQPFHDIFPDYDEKIRSGSDTEFPFGDGVGGNVDAQEEVGMAKFYYTNMELYDLLDPRAADSPYVYDNFEWPHCDEIGVYLGD